MRGSLLFLTNGAVVAAAGFVQHPAVTTGAALAGVFIIHRAWVAGHQDGYDDGREAAAALVDTLRKQARAIPPRAAP